MPNKFDLISTQKSTYVEQFTTRRETTLHFISLSQIFLSFGKKNLRQKPN